MQEFHGKNIFIVGATGGIGREAARAFLERGATVLAWSRDREKAERARREFNTDAYHAYAADMRDETQLAAAMTSMLNDHGTVDVVVYAPTLPTSHGAIGQKTWSDIQAHLDAQVKGLFLLTQRLLPSMKDGHRTKFIVLLTEYCIGKPPAGIADYVTAKHALLGLAKCLAVELARYGSTVNLISPGMTDTPLLSTVPPKAVEFTAQENPLGRIANPSDIIGAILYFASPAADYVTGSHLTVNGGNVMI